LPQRDAFRQAEAERIHRQHAMGHAAFDQRRAVAGVAGAEREQQRQVVTNLDSSQLVSRRLAGTRIVLCASPAYLAAHGTPWHPRELARHQVVSCAYWSGGDDWRFDGPEGEARVRVQPRIHTNSGDTCRIAALRGQGVILQPDFLVGDDLRRGDLIELLPAWHSVELGIHAVYASRKHLPMKTRRLVDFLVEAFAHPSWQPPRA
jgi:DNA-binding transcriptional LysR family regulator